MTTLDNRYLEVRSRICDTFLIWLSIAAIPMLAASLFRTVDIGWQPIMALHLFVATALWLTALYHKRLPYHARAGILLALMGMVGMGGIWSFGLAAGGIIWLLIAPILGTLLFGVPTGLTILACIFLATSVIGVMTVVGIKPAVLDLESYVSSASAWINSELSWVLMIGSTIVAIGILNRFFIESLATSTRQQQKLKEGEHEYRNILENMVDTFYRTDQAGRLVMISPSVINIGGFSPDELIGEDLGRYYTDSNKRAEFLQRLQEGDGEVSNFEAEVKTRYGGTVWTSTSARYWKDADGTVLGVEGTIRDITANRTAEEALRRSQKMEAVGQLTGGIAHDYNNMLGVIIGNIQMVEAAGDLDDKSRERLGKAFAAAQRNAELTNKLLGFSRSKAGGTKLTEANDFIASLEDIIARSLTASIEVRTDLAEDLWLVDIDPAELEDMILNLSINARDAMPGGGVLAIETANKVLDRDYVKYNPDSQAGDYIMIRVSDTGTGMSKDIREQIFDPFFSTKETGKGTGLGLSMVYAFVQRSGGFIKVYSEPGKGTTFSIFLPRAQEKKIDSKALDNVNDFELSRGSETILVVDDEEFLVDLAITQLEGLGYQTLSASNGDQALEVLKDNQGIDLLFSDIIMPGRLDGYDLALAAMKARPALKVLLTSGFARSHQRPSGEEEVAVAELAANLLGKPYTIAELATAVRHRLDEE